LKSFGLAVLKKNQGSMQKRNPKEVRRSSLHSKIQELQEQKEVWFKEEAKSRERHFISTMLQLSKVWSLQESLSRAKEKEGETRSIDCRRKGAYKED
jgi:hypothetical protein